MMGSWARRILRPRGLVLTVLLVVVAALLWRGANAQHEEDRALVAGWLQEAVREAQERRDAASAMGATEAVLAGAFAHWVRESVPPGTARDARITVEPLGSGPFGSRDGDATHRAEVVLPRGTATVEVRCSDGRCAATSFRSGPGKT